MDNIDQNMPIEEECKMNSEQNKNKTNSEPPIKEDENKEKRAIKKQEKCSAILIYRTSVVQDVTTTQPRATKQKTLEKVIINPTVDCKIVKKGFKNMDEAKKKIIIDAIQDCQQKEDALKRVQYYCYGIFDCMLLSYFAMHGFFCCPYYPVHITCPLIL